MSNDKIDVSVEDGQESCCSELARLRIERKQVLILVKELDLDPPLGESFVKVIEYVFRELHYSTHMEGKNVEMYQRTNVTLRNQISGQEKAISEYRAEIAKLQHQIEATQVFLDTLGQTLGVDSDTAALAAITVMMRELERLRSAARIRATVDEPPDVGTFVLTWRENGVPIVRPATTVIGFNYSHWRPLSPPPDGLEKVRDK